MKRTSLRTESAPLNYVLIVLLDGREPRSCSATIHVLDCGQTNHTDFRRRLGEFASRRFCRPPFRGNRGSASFSYSRRPFRRRGIGVRIGVGVCPVSVDSSRLAFRGLASVAAGRRGWNGGTVRTRCLTAEFVFVGPMI
jgi:hypothetical protein